MPNTDPSLETMDVVEAAHVPAFEEAARAPIVQLTASDQRWEPLKVQGFERISLFRKFGSEEYPQQHLALTVIVCARSLASFPLGLTLRYAMDREVLQGLRTANTTSTLLAFAEAHLKLDLSLALIGKLPRSHRRVVYLDHRGWSQENE